MIEGTQATSIPHDPGGAVIFARGNNGPIGVFVRHSGAVTDQSDTSPGMHRQRNSATMSTERCRRG